METQREAADNNKSLIETFCAITSSSPEEAIFFLESHNFDLDSAVSTFFENNTIDADSTRPAIDNPNSADYSPSPSPSPEPHPQPPPRASMASRDKKPSKPSGSRPGGIRTLADLNRADTGSDSDSDAPQEYYTGGQKSGMLVQEPSKGGNDVDSIFSKARQLGAMDGPAEHINPPSSSRSFTGTGRLLSGEPLPSAVAAPQPPESVIHNIVFWNNGFTVNDGPLRRLEDPENAPFLESIKKSECPKELEPADRRTQVKVNLVRREGTCPEPEKHQVSFQGVGRTLGSSTGGPSSSEQTAAAVAAAPLSTAPSPSVGLVVDATLPATSIQLRLADGTRMVARFNFHHTVRDIRAFIDASRPGSSRTYSLQTVGFPPKQLTDVNQTIEQAGLGNSVVIQKL